MEHPRVHLICTAHLDPVWQWRWEEGASEALATFRTAATLLNEHEGLIFNHNEALLYKWVRELDPGLFHEIKDLAAKGRWRISGGWHLQPDLNIPGTESLIRCISEGRKFFAEHFDARPRVAYNFDSFGHGPGLPQILRLFGYGMYIFMRPEKDLVDLPSDLFRWRGVDGTEIPALRISVGLYHTERDNMAARIEEGAELALRLNRAVPVFWGLGDHGGGPTRKDLAVIDDFISMEKRVEVIHSTPDRLLSDLEEAAWSAPIVEQSLQDVFPGSYTSLSRIKRRARKSLSRLVQAEALCTAAWKLRREPFPNGEFEKAWQGHLFNDFHDILPGTCTAPAEKDALDLYGGVAEKVRTLRLSAAAALNRGAPLDLPLPVTVLNANPCCTRVPVEFECMVDYRPLWKGEWHLELFDSSGKEIVCQEEVPEALLPFNGWRRKVSFMADLPALGRAVYRVDVAEGPPPKQECGPAGEPGPLEPLPLVVEDRGDSGGAACESFREIAGSFRPGSADTAVIETGPVRTIFERVYTYNRSRIVLHTITYPDWPVVEHRFRILWNEQRKMLKLVLPTGLSEPVLYCEVPGGVVRHSEDGREHVQSGWLMAKGKKDGTPAAVGIVNSGQHGFDFKEGEVRLSVLRSAAYCHTSAGFTQEEGSVLTPISLDPPPERRFMDQGEHELKLLVATGKPDVVRKMLPGLAEWIVAPPLVFPHLPATGHGRADELLTLSPQSVRLLSCRPAGDGQALVVRLQETEGRETAAVLNIFSPSLRINRRLKPFEIASMRIGLDNIQRHRH